MPEIRFINVKHGDFGIFEDPSEEYLCVWDCGTSQEKDYLKVGFPNMTPVDMIASEVRRILKYHENWTKDVLISHYHFDHYNGLEIFKQHGIIFRNMYVPYIDFSASYTSTLVYALALLDATAPYLGVRLKLFRDYSKLFTGGYAHNIYTVKRGDRIDFIHDSNNDSLEVLWPPYKLSSNASKSLEQFISSLEDALKKHDELSGALEKARMLFKKYKQTINIIQENIQDWENGKDSYLEYKLDKDNPEETDNIDNIHDLTGIKGDPEVKKAFRTLKNAIKNFIDDLSIAFRIGDSVLWMGDLKENVLEILETDTDIGGNYYIFKVPHHGTVDISILKNVTAEFLVISLSDGYHINGRPYKPPNKGLLCKACFEGSTILCTDGHIQCPLHKCKFVYSGLCNMGAKKIIYHI